MTDPFDRNLIRGSLDLMVMSVLADGAHYGYAIQKRVREVSADRVKLPAGTLYPMLHRLEAEKLIRSRWDRSTGRERKWYDLTAAGKRRLAQQATEWNDYADCIGKLIRPVLGGAGA